MKVSNIYSSNEFQHIPPSPQQIEAALHFIDPGIERDEWAKIGMALKAELGEDGFDLFDTWSSGGSSYSNSDCRDTWRSINGSGGITIASLFKTAIDNGYQPQQEKLSAADEARLKQQAAERAEQRREADRAAAAEEKAKHEAAAEKAVEQWDKAKPASPDHPYLKKKKITGKSLRMSGTTLLVPMRDDKERLWNVERVTSGSKRGLAGGRRKELLCAIPGKGGIVVAEGYATAESCHLATGWTALCAFGKSNLEAVARIARKRKPDARIVIAGDVGSEKHAQQAAAAVDGEVAIPPLKEDGGDFNDLHCQQGLDAVKAALEAAEEAKEWPAFIPLGSPNVPDFNLDCLPSWAGDYARALSQATETPPELAAGMVLVTCAAAVARRLNVMVLPGYFEPCNLWVVVALEPGNRKSAVQAGAAHPLIEWEHQQADEMAEEIARLSSLRKTEEARINYKRNKAAKEEDDAEAARLIKEIAELEADLPEVPISPQLWTSDATPERLGSLLADQGECMAWLSSEGGIFDLLQGRYSGGIPNLDLVLKAHSGDPERVDRGSRPPVFVRKPRLSIGLSPQPDVLAGLSAKPGFRGRGLLGRFLYLLPPSPLGYRSLKTIPVPDSIQRAYDDGIRAMLEWEPARNERNEEVLRIVRISAGGVDEWMEFARAIEEQMKPGGSMEYITDWAGKAPGAAARIAGVLHGIKHDEPWCEDISPETMRQALELMAVFTLHSRAAYDLMGADPAIDAAKRVWRWIERSRLSTTTVREVFQGVKGSFRRVSEVKAALEILEERGYLEVEGIARVPHKAGRPPSPAVKIRHEIAEGWK